MHAMIEKSWQGRFPTKAVNVGDVGLGGNHPIRLQSMTNTSTLNTKETVEQCLRIIEAGADYVRISVPNIKSAENLSEIKKHIREAGYNTPLIADIHYNPKIAIIAARNVEKIRINPGNYGFKATFDRQITTKINYDEELEQIHKNISSLLLVCREYGTAIRIGTNHGSLSPRILYRYGNTAEGMVKAASEYLDIFEDYGFYNTVIALKSSNPIVMIDAYRQMADAMMKRKLRYPMHLGVTEAGARDEGRIRSALGICSLLSDGIGDTIRVSLSEEPENEIFFAKKITKSFEKSYMTNGNRKRHFSEPEKFFIIERIRKKLPDKPFKLPVVISTCDDKKNIQPQNEDESKTQNYPSPDFTYCNKLTKTYSGNLILPYSSLEKQNNPGIFPLFCIEDLNKAKKDKSSLKFVFIKSADIFRKEVKSVLSLKGSVIILETTFETSLMDIIAALHRIYTYGSVPVILKCVTHRDDREQLIVEVSKLYGYMVIEGIINGLWIDSDDTSRSNMNTMLAYSLLQAAGKRITTNQYISCPTCARTSYNLEETIEEVKKLTQHLKGLKIAVMGCVVNGPGEMADADYGLVGSGNGKIHLYKKQQIIKKNVEQKKAVSELVNLIENFEKMKEKGKMI